MEPKVAIKLIIHSLFWIFYSVALFDLESFFFENLNINWYDEIEISLLLLVLGITYLNDLILLPYFFKRKQYAFYTIITIAMLMLVTHLYCYYILGCTDSLLECYSCDLWIFTFPLVFLSLIWVVLAFFENQKELEKAHKDKIELELKFLKAQINPHVLFNSLNTIYSKAVNENEAVAELILMLSENLKYVLNQSEDKLVDLERDITFIENYLKFQELRTQGVYNINYKKEIDSYNYSIAPLILIDFIENAFKHSVYKENELCDIDIFIKIQNGHLQFVCKNECNDSTEQKEQIATRIGLANLKQRLRLIYKDNYALDIHEEHGIFKVELNIDLR